MIRLLIVVVLGFAGAAALTGCHASAGIDTASSIVAPR
jgi:hypothetical protein